MLIVCKGEWKVSGMIEILLWEDEYGSRMKEEKNRGGGLLEKCVIVQVMRMQLEIIEH